MRPVPKISSEQENARVEPLEGLRAVTIRRDPVEPVPIGTYVMKVFRVTGYDPDCDGSLMARLSSVDQTGQDTGWEAAQLGLDPDDTIVVDSPGEAWRELEVEQ